MQMKLKRCLVIEFRLKMASEIILGASGSCVTMAVSSKTVIPTTLKGIRDKHGRLHPQLARTVAVLLQHAFGFNQNGNQENGYIILLFLRCNTYDLLARSGTGFGLGVGVDIFRPESESLEILRLRSPA